MIGSQSIEEEEEDCRMLKCLYVDPLSVCEPMTWKIPGWSDDGRVMCYQCVGGRRVKKKKKKAFRLSFHSATNL